MSCVHVLVLVVLSSMVLLLRVPAAEATAATVEVGLAHVAPCVFLLLLAPQQHNTNRHNTHTLEWYIGIDKREQIKLHLASLTINNNNKIAEQTAYK